jgi:hypothetical protein
MVDAGTGSDGVQYRLMTSNNEVRLVHMENANVTLPIS